MPLELAATLKLLLPVAKTVAPLVLTQVKKKLNPTDLQKALETGIKEAQTQEAGLPEQQQLFLKSPPEKIRSFIGEVFQHGMALDELRRPLNDEGMPRVAFLLKAFKQVTEKHPKIAPQESRIEPWLEAFARAYFEETDIYLKYQIAREVYLKQLEQRFEEIRFGGIDIEGQEAERSEKLVHIFVMPNVMEKSQGRSELKEFEPPFELLEEVGERQAAILLEQKQLNRLAKQQSDQKPFQAQKLLTQSDSRKQVILAGPGSGKTTLMSYFAVMLARQQPEAIGLPADSQWLPILIRIRDLDRQEDLNIANYLHTMAQDLYAEIPEGFFEYWLKAGRALILLDGLDEVADEGKRRRVVEHIDVFLHKYSSNRAIVTSRPAGYRPDYFRNDEFPHYQLQPFSDKQINEFLERWYKSRFENTDPAEGERRQNTLKKALEGNDRIKLLARNPLLLTVIVLIHRYRAYLPKKRYALYEKAVDTLLTAWDAEKELECSWDLEMLKRLMERVAYWIHSQGSVGKSDGGTLIDREELLRQLRNYLVEEQGIKPYAAKSEAKRFLNHIRSRSGLLNEQGLDCYAFVHKTFQEYLAAQEIRYRQENDGFGSVLEHIEEYLHNPHWREVLLLLVAQQPPRRATQCIEAILNYEIPYEEWLHRNLLFAGNCLTEDLRLSKSAMVDDILQQLIELEISKSSLISDKLSSEIQNVLCGFHETFYGGNALELLKTAVSDIESWKLRNYFGAFENLCELSPILLSRLDDSEEQVRSGAASALGTLGNASEDVISSLLSCLDDSEKQVRSGAAWALGTLGNASEDVISSLLSCLDDSEEQVCSSAARALGNLGNASEEVISSLLSCVESREGIVPLRAFLALGQFGEATLSYLKDTDIKIRSNVAIALSLGKASEEVISALLNLLDDSEGRVRSTAARALGNLGNASEEVISSLLSCLDDSEEQVRSGAARALGNLGNASEEVISSLLSCLDDSEEQVRSGAVYALGRLGKASEEVISSLLSCLDDSEEQVRSGAASALGSLGNASEEVISSLLSCLDDSEEQVRSGAASALGSLGNASEEVISSLLSCLDDSEEQVRSGAVYALGSLGKASEEVISSLLSCLDDSEKQVRSNVAEALGNLSNASEEVISSLLSCLDDSEVEVRSNVAEALGKLGKHLSESSNNHIQQIVQWIKQHQDSDYVSYGISILWDLEMDE